MNTESPETPFVHRSETRRKACSGCVKAKRRCDLVLPTCRRCKTKRLKCKYVGESVEHLSTAKSACSETDRSNKLSERNFTLVNYDNNKDLTPCGDLCLALRFVQPGYMTKQQLNYMTTQFRGFIMSIVSDGETPFIHHRLYQESMPRLYQDALSICSLYTQKTPRNQDTVFRILGGKFDSLLQESDSLRVEDNLLSLQVLILYQIIRLLDGDKRQRAMAERHLGLLDSWTLRLQQNCSQAVSTPTVRYDNWVLIESIRRTTMMSVILRAVYSALKYGECDLCGLLATLSVSTRSDRLWKTEEKWEEVESTDKVVTYAEFTDEWNKGRVFCVGDYEKLLLIACRYAQVAGKLDPLS